MAARLQFEGIRCFAEPQDAVVRPLTLLVGENSSGKSTFLALYQIASSIVSGSLREFPFNEAPFLLGAYDQIASYRGGRARRARSFSIRVSVEDDQRQSSIRAEFVPRAGQPSLHAWHLTAGDALLRMILNDTLETASILATSPRGSKEIQSVRWFGFPRLVDLPFVLLPVSGGLKTIFSKSDIDALSKAGESIRAQFGLRTYAFAPIRTSPQRTYDPVSAEPKPEGSHVPMLLASLAHAANSHWATLKSALKDFGSASGLFDQIDVIRKGKKESDPFQIGVKTGGPAFNLVDVGYGVSQALPILVDTLQRSSGGEVFLLQQPEVHLHPRAQAELGSFFARQTAKRRRFVVETHSDYLVDRVRVEVRRGTLRPDDVSLLYFEREEHGATVHNLELGEDGRITNPPPGFREFFLDEERSVLEI